MNTDQILPILRGIKRNLMAEDVAVAAARVEGKAKMPYAECGNCPDKGECALAEVNPWHKADGTFGWDNKGSWAPGDEEQHKASGKGKRGAKSNIPCGRAARKQGMNVRCQD